MPSAPPNPLAHPSGSLRVGNILLAPLRRMLYLIVRTQVTPEQMALPRADPQCPLCYVLQDRHLSSLLVLETEARRLDLPSALTRMGREFPVNARSGILGHPQSESVSARTAEPSATLSQMIAALLRTLRSMPG